MTYIQPRHRVREGYRFPRSVCAVSFDAGPLNYICTRSPTLFVLPPTPRPRRFAIASFRLLDRRNYSRTRIAEATRSREKVDLGGGVSDSTAKRLGSTRIRKASRGDRREGRVGNRPVRGSNPTPRRNLRYFLEEARLAFCEHYPAPVGQRESYGFHARRVQTCYRSSLRWCAVAVGEF